MATKPIGITCVNDYKMRGITLLLLLIVFSGCKGQNNQSMGKELLSEYISPAANAKVVVLFGGNPNRRDEVIRFLKTLGPLSIYGTLSEEEGIRKLTALKKVDLVVIGGRYSDEQRVRIRSFVKANLPETKITEPGYDYPYDNREIVKAIRSKLQLTDN